MSPLIGGFVFCLCFCHLVLHAQDNRIGQIQVFVFQFVNQVVQLCDQGGIRFAGFYGRDQFLCPQGINAVNIGKNILHLGLFGSGVGCFQGLGAGLGKLGLNMLQILFALFADLGFILVDDDIHKKQGQLGIQVLHLGHDQLLLVPRF